MELGQRTTRDQPNRRACVACPNCKQGYRVAARLIGRRLVCRHCRHEWRCEEIDPLELRRLIQTKSSDDSPSDSTQAVLPEDLPPVAGSSSTVIDTHWIGRKLGRYKILSVLGQGGMGVVWRGHDETLRRDVALKILNRTRKSSSKPSLNAELFMQEARAVAKLQHPNVVAIFEVAEDQGQAFLALELMEGGTLKEFVDRNGPIAPRELFAMAVGPAKALALAHRRGIIHRDIKPGNLMFDDHGHLKLMDFGLADVAQEAASERMKGKAVGSLGWVAPETVRGQGTTGASDIYAMGLVLLYALTGKPWLHAASRQELIALHQNPPPLDLSQYKQLSARDVALLKKCLAVDPQERFADADQLAQAMKEASLEDPIVLSHQRRRNHASIAAIAASFGLVLGIGGVSWYFVRLADQANEFSMPVAQRPGTAQKAPVAAVPKFATLAEAKVPWPQVPYLIDASELSFVAGKDGVVHVPSCEKAREIWASDLQNFDKIEDALAKGYKPCPLCHPNKGPRPDVVMGPGD